jgi:O-phospho-L-seryl-tRNASec:L-selenocysteinyl-tRNA synthase
MDQRTLDLLTKLVTPSYVQNGREALHSDESAIRSIVAQRRMPENGLPDPLIQHLLQQLALMDTNNALSHCGAGEREGRVISNLVRSRHFYMTHGIGRSGDLRADQPKAAGSSCLYQMANFMVLDAIRLAGCPKVEEALIVPMATGMTLGLLLRSLTTGPLRRPQTAKYVVIPRIDQKTCLKCIVAAGFLPLVVELRPKPLSTNQTVGAIPASASGNTASGATTTGQASSGETEMSPDGEIPQAAFFLESHVDDIAEAIDKAGGPDHILCIMSVTSCFAPRLPDDTLAIGRLCVRLNIPHIVNNAYGVQSMPIMKRLNSALDESTGSRVDAFVQSTDKNFLVPVGGAVVAGKTAVVRNVAALYAGRASSAPIVDLFITLLSLGRRGWQNLLQQREQCLEKFIHLVNNEVAAPNKESVFCWRDRNNISFGMTLRGLVSPGEIGAKLFAKRVTGPRVILSAGAAVPTASSPLGSISTPMAVTPSSTSATSGAPMQQFSLDPYAGLAPPSTIDSIGSAGLGANPHDAAGNLDRSMEMASSLGPRAPPPTPNLLTPAVSTDLQRPAAATASGTTTIAGLTFKAYGTHSDTPNVPMLIMACGIGMKSIEVDEFCAILKASYQQCKRRDEKKTHAS